MYKISTKMAVKAITVALFACAMTSCAYLEGQEKNPPTPHERTCSALKRDLALYDRWGDSLDHRSTPTYKAHLLRQYESNNCEERSDK